MTPALLLVLLLLLLGSFSFSLAKNLAGQSSSFLVIQRDGQVYATGRDKYGQLGLGGSGSGTTTVAFPKPMLSVSNATDVSLGEQHGCIVDRGGKAKCTGADVYGQLGRGGAAAKSSRVLVAAGPTASFTTASIECGRYSTCAISTRGASRCWGFNPYGALGSGGKSSAVAAVRGFESSAAKAVSIGYLHACWLRTDGAVLCAGSDSYGQLGDGTNTDSAVPVLVEAGAAAAAPFASVACGDHHTCASNTLGEVYCWGSNWNAQLGLEHAVPQSSLPVLLASPLLVSKARSVWAGYASTFVLLEEGHSAVAFGQDVGGALGTGSSAGEDQPHPVPFAAGRRGIAEIRGGGATTCLLTTGAVGEVWCVGDNSHGQFGVGRTPASSVVLIGRDPVIISPGEEESTKSPTSWPTSRPTKWPTSKRPTAVPTSWPTKRPTAVPTTRPTNWPTFKATKQPTAFPTTLGPSTSPTLSPTTQPTTRKPTRRPTKRPTLYPTTKTPTAYPTTTAPSASPTTSPTMQPTRPTRRPVRSG